jgi:ATP-dependent DNA helicase RecQ
MADQERRLREQGLVPVILRGGQSPQERQAIWEQLHTGQSRFIIANPEVLLTPSVLGRLKTLGIVHIVIDEAHCISQWGETFRPSYRELGRIITAAQGTPAPVVTAFTATASDQVLAAIETVLFGEEQAHRIIANPDRPNIRYAAQGCILRDLAVRDLLLRHRKPALVFCASRYKAERLARYLCSAGEGEGTPVRDIRFYHAGLNREEKSCGERWFLRHPQGVLVATCAYGMGVDKGDIRTVIHRDCPPSVEAYLQESGRAGRDGEAAAAILLWGPEDEEALQRRSSEVAQNRLRALLDYARDTGLCRRRALLRLLNYEGEGLAEDCCDVCSGEATDTLREEASLRSFFASHRRFYTLREAAKALAKAAPRTWSVGEAEEAVRKLIALKTLDQSPHLLWKHKLELATRRKGVPLAQFFLPPWNRLNHPPA